MQGHKPAVHCTRLPEFILLTLTAADNKCLQKECRKQWNTFTSHLCLSITASARSCVWSAVTLPFMNRRTSLGNPSILLCFWHPQHPVQWAWEGHLECPSPGHPLRKACLFSSYGKCCCPSLCSAFHFFYTFSKNEGGVRGDRNQNNLHYLKCSHPMDLYSNVYIFLFSAFPRNSWLSFLALLNTESITCQLFWNLLSEWQ